MIRLDLGLLVVSEHVENSRTVEASIYDNIKSEELFDPPSKKLNRDISSDSVKPNYADNDKVLDSPKIEDEDNEERNMLHSFSMVQAHTQHMRTFKRRNKEIGIGSIGSECRNTTMKKDDDREYREEEERKKVMGMSDVHLVQIYVY